jgi:hypothetical protein
MPNNALHSDAPRPAGSARGVNAGVSVHMRVVIVVLTALLGACASARYEGPRTDGRGDTLLLTERPTYHFEGDKKFIRAELRGIREVFSVHGIEAIPANAFEHEPGGACTYPKHLVLTANYVGREGAGLEFLTMWTLFLVPVWYNDAPKAEFQVLVYDNCVLRRTISFTEYSKTLMWLPAWPASWFYRDQPKEIGQSIGKAVLASLTNEP